MNTGCRDVARRARIDIRKSGGAAVTGLAQVTLGCAAQFDEARGAVAAPIIGSGDNLTAGKSSHRTTDTHRHSLPLVCTADEIFGVQPSLAREFRNAIGVAVIELIIRVETVGAIDREILVAGCALDIGGGKGDGMVSILNIFWFGAVTRR